MADGSLITENMDISKLKVPDLKRELKARGLSTAGNKTDLMDRLQTALKSKIDDMGSVESVADDLDDDLLNDDDLDHEHLEAAESVLTELDEQLDISPVTKTTKRKLSETKLSTDSDSKPTKKVVLNREPSVTDEVYNKLSENGNNSTNVDSKSNQDPKRVIKLSELSAKERLEMRAKKFGAPISVEARKLVRAERFSLSSVSSASKDSTNISLNSGSNLDMLKKRAERFGGSVSKVMSNLELQERLEQRKARFGIATTANGATSQSEKAKERLERFKTPIK